ncbi:MAG: DUF2934 domain-containing protein [Betaproteobacteria bacterium]|nr:DUF2934 domain-containing protein [Betaproteobacteria bacterium]
MTRRPRFQVTEKAMKSGKPMSIPKRAAVMPGVAAGKRRVQSRAKSAAIGVGNTRTVLGPEDRRHMIEVAAYFRAERRGFAAGTPEQDWLEAEAEVDRMLAGSATH